MTDRFVYFEDQLADKERLYTNPIEIITAYCPEDVAPMLAKMQDYHDTGHYLAGYFSYELGYLLERSLVDRFKQKANEPLFQFGVFSEYKSKSLSINSPVFIEKGKALWTLPEYQEHFDHVLDYIQAGDVYQINLSFPLTGQYYGNAQSIYDHLKSRQPVSYGGCISLGSDAIVSLSPELFVKNTNQRIHMRPMKGTCARDDDSVKDKRNAQALQKDAKNRAENLMIVDLLRNDLSRISEAGSVHVTDLFSIETYPTLHTMTSGIEATLKPKMKLETVLQALFPCGSVTGAPKIRAQEIIDELEPQTRGAYCGSQGFIDPNGDMCFNVGIRTLVLKPDQNYVLNIGSGIVADSNGQAEYEECLLKGAFLQNPFDLIETIGWDSELGFMNCDLHMKRLHASSRDLGFVFNEATISMALHDYVQGLPSPQIIRIVLKKNAEFHISHRPLLFKNPEKARRIAVSKNYVLSGDPLREHKTTRREFFEKEFARVHYATQCDEVIFFNEQELLCEGSYTSIFVKNGDVLLTPTLSAGLLPGILRHILLANGDAVEADLQLSDLLNAEEIYIGNSVRGLMKAELIDTQRI